MADARSDAKTPRDGTQSQPISSRRGILFGALLIVFAALLVFGGGGQFSHEFTNWDDNWLVTENRWIRSFDGESLSAVLNPWTDMRIREELGNEYLPVRDLTSMLNYAVAGYDARWWHGFDLLLHVMVSLLVGLLAMRLFRAGLAGLLAGLLFAVMPIHVEVVSWVSCRKDLLSALFGLLSVLSYLRWRGLDHREDKAPSHFWLVSGLVCFLLALFSKVPVITLPGVLVLAEVFLASRLRPVSMRAKATAIGAYFAVAVLVFAAIAYPIASNGLVREPFGGSRISNTLTALASVGDYFVALVAGLPVGPVVDAPLRESLDARVARGLVLGLAALALVAWVAWRMRPKVFLANALPHVGAWSLIGLGMGWLLVTLFPVSNLLIVTGTAYADRYAYLPSVGFCLAIVGAFSLVIVRVPKPHQTAALACVLILSAWYGILAQSEVGVWRSSMTLWNDVLERDPENHNALFNRALVKQADASRELSPLAQRLLLEAAEADLRLAFEHPARTFRYDQARVLAAIANIRLELASLEKSAADRAGEDANRYEREAVRLEVRTGATNSRAERDRYLGDASQSRKLSQSAGERRTRALTAAEGHLNEVLALARAARDHLDAPWRIQRDRLYIEAQLSNSEGLALDRLGKPVEAEAKFRAAAAMTDRNPSACLNLAAMLARRGEDISRRRGYTDEAEASFAEAIALIDRYDAARGYLDRQSLSMRGQVLSKQAESIEGPDSREQPRRVAELYEESARLFRRASDLAKQMGAALDPREWASLKSLEAEMWTRIPGQEEKAIGTAKEAAQAGGDTSQAELRQAKLLLQTGESDRAMELLLDLLGRYPSDAAVRRELAAVYASVAQARYRSLIAAWKDEYLALVPSADGKDPDHHLIMAKFMETRKFREELDRVSAATDRSLELAEPDSEAAKLGAVYLTTLAHAWMSLGELATCEPLLRRSYAQNPDYQVTSELLAMVYFTLLEDLSRRSSDAAKAGLAGREEDLRKEMWDLITNLVVVSPRASELLAAQLVRRANEYKVALDDKYVQRDGSGGFDPATGRSTTREWIPDDLLADYRREMQPVVQLYELARTLDSGQRNALTQLNDYYGKTGDYEQSLTIYEVLEATFKDRPGDALAVRTSMASLLSNWALDLEKEYRMLLLEKKEAEARKTGAEALAVLRRADKAWHRVLELAPANPSREVLSSTGGVLQKMAVLDLPGASEHLRRAVMVYSMAPEQFAFELTAVYRKRAIFAANDGERVDLLRLALSHAATPEEREDITLQISEVESRGAVDAAQTRLAAGDPAGALEVLDKSGLRTQPARILRGRALDALGKPAEAAAVMLTCAGDAPSLLRAAEILVAQGSDRALGDAHGALVQARHLLADSLVAADIAGENKQPIEASLSRVRELSDQIARRSVALVDEAREARSFGRKSTLLRTAVTIAPGNYEAHSMLASALREWGGILMLEAKEKGDSGDREGEAVTRQEARAAFDEANQCWLNVLALDPPFALKFRIEQLELLLHDLAPLALGPAREGLLAEAGRLLNVLGRGIEERERTAPDDPALARQRTAIASLRARHAELAPGK